MINRVAALYDIHSNLPALEAVLEEIREAGVELIIIGGDVVPGPMPRESLSLLRGLDLPVQFLYGNGEVAVLQQMAGLEPAMVPEAFRPPIRWVAGQLNPGDQAFLASWPMTLRVSIDGLGEVLFCHATPRNENEIFTRLTDEMKLLPVFGCLGVSMVVCGHTHMQFDMMVGEVRVVNPGSVGMPFGEPGAYWVLLGPDAEFQRTSYNFKVAAEAVRRTAYPQAEQFASGSILQPPSEDQMLEIFSHAEIQ